jgi:hypothetical protein
MTQDTAPVEASWSDLATRPREVAAEVDAHGAVMLHRRDAADLWLVHSDRLREERLAMGLVASLLSELVRTDATRGQISSILRQQIPWTGLLSQEDSDRLAHELIEAMEAGRDASTMAPLGQVVSRWTRRARLNAEGAPPAESVLEAAYFDQLLAAFDTADAADEPGDALARAAQRSTGRTSRR